MERVTKAEAARQMEVNRSTLTRWCAKHPALVDDDGLVSVDELKDHRDTVLNPALQTRGGQKEAKPEPKASDIAVSSLNADRARRERARADAEELDLAQRLGQTLRRDDVERALQSAAEIIRQTGSQLVKDHAERLASMEDPRAVEVHLDEMMRVLQARAADALIAAAGDEADNAA